MALQTLTRQDLLDAMKSMTATDLDWLVSQVMRVRAARRSVVLSAEESALLMQINQTSFPAEIQGRYKTLVGKLEDESLAETEHV
jgi:transposase